MKRYIGKRNPVAYASTSFLPFPVFVGSSSGAIWGTGHEKSENIRGFKKKQLTNTALRDDNVSKKFAQSKDAKSKQTKIRSQMQHTPHHFE